MYGFTFKWKGELTECTQEKFNHKWIALLIDNAEINSRIGTSIELGKVDGRLEFLNNYPEQHTTMINDIIEAIEAALRKPLLWLLDDKIIRRRSD